MMAHQIGVVAAAAAAAASGANSLALSEGGREGTKPSSRSNGGLRKEERRKEKGE